MLLLVEAASSVEHPIRAAVVCLAAAHFLLAESTRLSGKCEGAG